jgi:hypothetical protein
MQWTIKLEFTPDGGKTISHPIGTITRPIADLRPEEIGLTLAEGHELIRDIERRMISDQIHIYTLCFRRCIHCGQRQPFKDVRTKCVLTVFGAYRFRGRRIRLCRCQVDRGCMASFFPLGHIIPRRTTPEIRHLFAQLGARMPYREASRVMQMFGFGCGRAGRMAIWRHTVTAGRRIEGDQLAAVRGGADRRPSVERLLIGIDDTYIRHRQRDASRQIQVTAGRFERDGKLAERFAFVRSVPEWSPDQFQGILIDQGTDTCKCVQVMTDGDDGLRNFVQRAAGVPIEPQLDWFHIGMRLERLRKIVHLPVTYAEYRREPEAFDPMERRVKRVRHALWHGRVRSALDHLTALRHDLELWSATHPDRALDALGTTIRAIDEFEGYVGGNRRGVPNFAKARAAGRRISTAHVESVMNHLINHRLGKRQQMRWSPAGAHYLLQVRADVLNGLDVHAMSKVPN